MNIFFNLDDLPAFQKTVITIGAFDGVHAGHQKIVKRVHHLAKEQAAESVVITFHPHPREVIYPKDTSLELLTTLEEKFPYFEREGIDHVVVVPFTIEFSQMSPREYVEKFLIGNFHPASIVIGYDHRFGLNRAGNVDLLKEYERKGLFTVVEIAKHETREIVISSTKIRNAISNADIKLANQLLGHAYVLSGKIVHGQKLGTRLGFPTANIEVDFSRKLVPPDGIYAVRVEVNEREYEGMLYIGKRPTLGAGEQKSIEVNIFHFNQRIYGESIRVFFMDFIRTDQQFDSLDDLRAQLEKDRTHVMEYFREPNAPEQMTPELAVVILNYNGLSFLEKFLDSFTRIVYSNYRIYLADNASTDSSIAFVEKYFPSVHVIRLDRNYGFAEGYNRALGQIEADYYAIVNSDLELTPEWASRIITYMEEHPDTAVCQPKILDVKNKEAFEYAGAAGGYIDLLGYPFCRGRILDTIEKDTGQYNDIQSIFWATGAACIIRAEAFRLVGGFDRDYFAHQEEIDLCWRLQRAGYQIRVIPSSIVFHVGGGTLDYQDPHKVYLNFRNNLATLIKNQSRLPLMIVLLIRLVLDGLAGLNFIVKGQFKNCSAVVRAHLSLYGWIPGLMKKRRAFKKRLADMHIEPVKKLKGVYRGYMLIDYYLMGRKRFSRLPVNKGTNEL